MAVELGQRWTLRLRMPAVGRELNDKTFQSAANGAECVLWGRFRDQSGNSLVYVSRKTKIEIKKT
jgi:hypothetical protein